MRTQSGHGDRSPNGAAAPQGDIREIPKPSNRDEDPLDSQGDIDSKVEPDLESILPLLPGNKAERKKRWCLCLAILSFFKYIWNKIKALFNYLRTWEGILYFFKVMSEASNTGIVLQAVSKWLPIILVWGKGIIPPLAAFADILIYIFKILIRFTLILGRKLGVVFDVEKNGHHRFQNWADAVAMVFFFMAVLFFAGAFVAGPVGPVGIAIGWSFAMVGLFIVGLFDEFYQVVLANNALLKARCSDIGSAERFDLLKEDRKAAITSAVLYGCLLGGLSLLLIAGPFCLFVAKAAVFILVAVAISRYLTSRWQARVCKDLKELDGQEGTQKPVRKQKSKKEVRVSGSGASFFRRRSWSLSGDSLEEKSESSIDLPDKETVKFETQSAVLV